MAAEYVARMGERIRARREELGLSRADVARKMPGKTNENAIYRWENGLHRPQDDTLEALADVLGTTMAYFLASDEEDAAVAADSNLGDDSVVLREILRRVKTLETALTEPGEAAAGRQPPGELGRRATGSQPKTQPQKPARGRRAAGARRGKS